MYVDAAIANGAPINSDFERSQAVALFSQWSGCSRSGSSNCGCRRDLASNAKNPRFHTAHTSVDHRADIDPRAVTTSG